MSVVADLVRVHTRTSPAEDIRTEAGVRAVRTYVPAAPSGTARGTELPARTRDRPQPRAGCCAMSCGRRTAHGRDHEISRSYAVVLTTELLLLLGKIDLAAVKMLHDVLSDLGVAGLTAWGAAGVAYDRRFGR